MLCLSGPRACEEARAWRGAVRSPSFRRRSPTRRVAPRSCSSVAGPTASFVPLAAGAAPTRLENSSALVRMSGLRTPDLAHRRHRDAPLETASDDVVSGRAFDDDALQRHVGAATGGPTRRHLQDGLAADAKAAALNDRSEPRTSRRRRRGRSDRIFPFRVGDAFFEPGNAGKILIAGAVEVIERDTNKSKPRRKGAKYSTRARAACASP